eukprot:1188055-Amphidinium_carterae.1
MLRPVSLKLGWTVFVLLLWISLRETFSKGLLSSCTSCHGSLMWYCMSVKSKRAGKAGNTDEGGKPYRTSNVSSRGLVHDFGALACYWLWYACSSGHWGRCQHFSNSLQPQLS